MSRAAEAPRWAEQYASGMTVEQIALDGQTSAGTVRRWLHRLGVEMRPVGERAGVNRRPGPRTGDIAGLPDPQARIVRPSVARYYR
jgi:hypothetical protein